MRLTWKSVPVLSILLTACGSQPDASGMYVAADENSVLFVQLVQADGGKLNGRIEFSSVGEDGTLKRNQVPEDGSISGHDVLLRGTSFWTGGMDASGTLSGQTLHLMTNGQSMDVRRSSPGEYEKALARLSATSAARRQSIAAAQRLGETASAQIQLDHLGQRLSTDTEKLQAAIGDMPAFAKRAAANTARLQQMVSTASSRPSDASQLSVAGNQIEVDTNQIEVSRAQYALLLNGIVDDGTAAAAGAERLCGSPPPDALRQRCAAVRSAADAFRQMVGAGRPKFLPVKQQLEAELQQQSKLLEQIG